MENVNIQDVTPEMLFESGFQVEFVVRKHPKPAPIFKRKKDGTYVVINEVTQEQMDYVIEKGLKEEEKRKRSESTTQVS